MEKTENRPLIVVVGSSNTDMVIKVDHLPRPGETIIGHDFMTNQGGKGANQAVAACRMGGRVAFVARVGDDSFGRQAIDMMRNEGIDTTFVLPRSRPPRASHSSPWTARARTASSWQAAPMPC